MKTTTDLELKLASTFHSMDGPPAAYFELKTGIPELPVVRMVYTTLEFAARGEPEDADPVLLHTLYSAITDHMTDEQREEGAQSNLLIWRKRPVLGDYTDEKGRQWRKIRCRVFIPGVAFPSPVRDPP